VAAGSSDVIDLTVEPVGGLQVVRSTLQRVPMRGTKRPRARQPAEAAVQLSPGKQFLHQLRNPPPPPPPEAEPEGPKCGICMEVRHQAELGWRRGWKQAGPAHVTPGLHGGDPGWLAAAERGRNCTARVSAVRCCTLPDLRVCSWSWQCRPWEGVMPDRWQAATAATYTAMTAW
jgi:hypothetical protein